MIFNVGKTLILEEDSWREVKVWLYFGGWVRVRTVLDQAYKLDLLSTTCVSGLVEPLSFFLEFLPQSWKLKRTQ